MSAAVWGGVPSPPGAAAVNFQIVSGANGLPSASFAPLIVAV